MTAGVINKIVVTEEAAFDYTEALGLGALNKRMLKSDIEEYIDIQNRNGRLKHERYFRCQYLDEESGRMLMLFLYRAERISIMQYWLLAGVCFAEGWSEDAENSGEIRGWLNEKITDLKKGDWVIEQQLKAEAEAMIVEYYSRGSIKGLPKEIKNAVEYGHNQKFT